MCELKTPWRYRRHDVVDANRRAPSRRCGRRLLRSARAPSSAREARSPARRLRRLDPGRGPLRVGRRLPRPARHEAGPREGEIARPRHDGLHGQRRRAHDASWPRSASTGSSAIVRICCDGRWLLCQAEQASRCRLGKVATTRVADGSACCTRRREVGGDALPRRPGASTRTRVTEPRKMCDTTSPTSAPSGSGPSAAAAISTVSGRTSTSTRSPVGRPRAASTREPAAAVLDDPVGDDGRHQPVHRADELGDVGRRRSCRTSRAASRPARYGRRT